MNEHRILIYLAWSTLLIVIFIAVLLIVRRGNNHDTGKILDAIEATRNQIDVLDQRTEGDLRAVKGWMQRLLERFGFLK